MKLTKGTRHLPERTPIEEYLSFGREGDVGIVTVGHHDFNLRLLINWSLLLVLCLFLDRCVLVLLVFGDQVLHVRLSLGELKDNI